MPVIAVGIFGGRGGFRDKFEWADSILLTLPTRLSELGAAGRLPWPVGGSWDSNAKVSEMAIAVLAARLFGAEKMLGGSIGNKSIGAESAGPA